MKKLSLRERVLLVCLAIIAAVSAYVLLFQMPSARRAEELEARIAQGGEVVALLEAKLAEQRRMEGELATLADRDDAPAVMPDYDNTQAVMLELHRILAGCREYALSFGTVQAQEDGVVRRQVTIPFTCADYASARAVLEDLHDSDLRCLMEDVSFSQAEDGTVKVTVTMTFLEYGSPEEGTQTAE